MCITDFTIDHNFIAAAFLIDMNIQTVEALEGEQKQIAYANTKAAISMIGARQEWKDERLKQLDIANMSSIDRMLAEIKAADPLQPFLSDVKVEAGGFINTRGNHISIDSL